MIRLASLLALILVGLTLGAATPAPEDFQVTASATYQYGQALTFELVVEDARPVSEVTLSFQAPGLPYLYTVTSPPPASAPFTVTHTIDLTDPNLGWQLVPFAPLTYQWSLSTAAGAVTLPAAQLTYDDDQFDWQRWSNGAATVFWPGGDELGPLVGEIVADSEPRLRSFGLGPLPADLRIFVYPTVADLRAGLRLAGVDWRGDRPSERLTVVLVTAVNARTAASDLRQTVPFQLAHLLISQRVAPAAPGLPRWFREGLARNVILTPDPNEALLLQEAVAAGTVLPLAELCDRWPVAEPQATLAGVQSAAVVAFVLERYAVDVVSEMLTVAATNPDCETTVQTVLGISSSELGAAWLADQAGTPTPAQWWQRNGLWLLILLAGFIISSLLILGLTGRVDSEEESTDLERVR